MAIFREENEELIDDFKEHFLIMVRNIKLLLDRCMEDGVYSYKEIFDELFRIFHNLKSSTSYFELEDISKLCHKAEDVIQNSIETKYQNIQANANLLYMVYNQLSIWCEDIVEESDCLSPIDEEIKIVFNHL